VSGKIKQKYRLKMVFSLPVLKYFYLVLSYFKILKSFEKTKNGEIFLVKLFLKTNLTEVSLSDCPLIMLNSTAAPSTKKIGKNR